MGEESPEPGSTPTGAVFLSYASQDAEPAKRICDALRAAGIEVWFDRSELRGGDAWDRSIRQQIHECRLFMPIISARTEARIEGYFRREWKLAVDRTHDLSERVAFLVPVVIDSTAEPKADVPDAFRHVQWTRLPGGEASAAFIERVSHLLSPDQASVQPHTTLVPRSTPPNPKGLARRSGPFRRWQPALLLAVAVVVAALGYLALDEFWLSKRGTASAPTTGRSGRPDVGAQSSIPEKSIAVLPFVDMSEKHDQGYFSDGISEELIDMLARVSDLRVPARTSSFYFKGKSDDIQTIAQKLRVAHVLEGSVRRAGNRLRVTAQLIRADDGYHVWSQTYDRESTDVFKVQDDIAGAVVDALMLKLAPGREVVESHGTENAEAYNQFLLGRQFWLQGTVDGFHGAIIHYRKAIDFDPGYAAAYAGLALAEALLADQTADQAGIRRAAADADKAVALAPEQPEGYSARGRIREGWIWDWAGAQSDIEKALALNPNSSEVQLAYCEVLQNLGRLTEAIAAGNKATHLDPLSNDAWLSLGGALTWARQFSAAHEALGRALEIQPESDYALNDLGQLRLLEGDAAGALDAYRKVKIEPFRLAGIAMAEHSLGHARESNRALDEAIARFERSSPYPIVWAYAWRGEKDKAFDWLERAYLARDGGVSQVKGDVLLSALHDDPRFKAFLRKINLPE